MATKSRKTTAAKKSSRRASTAKKATTKKGAAKKAVAKKGAAKKAPARKAAAKKGAAKKAPAKKAAAKKAPAKKGAAKKAGARRAATKQGAARTASVKKAPARKAASKGAAAPAARKPAARARKPEAAPQSQLELLPRSEPTPPKEALDARPATGSPSVEEVETTSAGVQPLAPEHAAVDELTSSGNEVLDIFQRYDRNRTGSIERSEFARLLEALGQNVTDEELEIAVDAVDTDRTGKISWKEFKAWWSSR
ncbi:EF-hand domain-containing protein [Pyxidicoccus xibeiensis]|uniref:EF-hand domain-containing protein n=1 Tax=Pyxidicoccus xibeiensis TaxID=2906759 RepID=UPI0020A7D949|nr:EF-hand domain-containing protein [Pyxidicoccus xibeiensis]MCP3143537.1 EF-hand domain-containing protein [Pyxidicoccus xibeiensis]